MFYLQVSDFKSNTSSKTKIFQMGGGPYLGVQSGYDGYGLDTVFSDHPNDTSEMMKVFLPFRFY